MRCEMKYFATFESRNECNRSSRHWVSPLVEPVAHGETKGFTLLRPRPHWIAKLADYVCLVQANTVLGIRKPRGQILFFMGLFLLFTFL